MAYARYAGPRRGDAGKGTIFVCNASTPVGCRLRWQDAGGSVARCSGFPLDLVDFGAGCGFSSEIFGGFKTNRCFLVVSISSSNSLLICKYLPL